MQEHHTAMAQMHTTVHTIATRTQLARPLNVPGYPGLELSWTGQHSLFGTITWPEHPPDPDDPLVGRSFTREETMVKYLFEMEHALECALLDMRTMQADLDNILSDLPRRYQPEPIDP